MKKTLLILSIAAIAFGSSCKKKSSTTVTPVTLPVYTIDGIHDLYMAANSYTTGTVTLPITVQFQDSFQKQVTLSLSDLPAGITIDNRWSTTGYPTFGTSITFYDTSLLNPAPIGTYPMTLTATGPAGTQKFSFNVKVAPQTTCVQDVIGSYLSCYSSCNFNYGDTVTEDATSPNKIWFKNIGKTHSTVYALYRCTDQSFIIPAQSVNGFNFKGSGVVGSVSGNPSISLTLMYGTDTCITATIFISLCRPDNMHDNFVI